MPLDIGTIHFVGIGGIGMSGIAEILHNLGYAVQGSDIAENANVKRLRKFGIKVSIGHSEDNIGEVGAVVVSSAVKQNNPEIVAARSRLIPVVRRAEMLAELMRLKWAIAVGGTHGKTTTTSIIASMLEAADYDPTVVNGGIINAYDTNARLGESEWLVAEADESDGSFTKLPATFAVVTNIDPEHLDFYGSFDKLKEAFQTFVENIPFYGFACLCIDNQEVQALIPKLSERKIITYGLSSQADIRAVDIKFDSSGSHFDVIVTDRNDSSTRKIENVFFPMYGEHNVQNALAAVAFGVELKFDDETIRSGLKNFSGVKRRFTNVGEAGGITVIDDYGHHPVEINSALKAARHMCDGNVIAVFQPHRYSRLESLFDDFCTCFNDADCVIVTDVYAANETPIPNIDRDAVVKGLKSYGHRNVISLENPQLLAQIINAEAKSEDVVICLGAGNITNMAYALPEQLTALQES